METLNDFIGNNNLVLDIKDKYRCNICSGILVEPLIARCLCNFCKKCVLEYLKDEVKQCPGCIKNNQEMLLNYATDVRENFFVEAKLKSFKCKCVFSNCDEQIELRYMVEHIEKCVHNDILNTGDLTTLKVISILRNVINEIKDKVEKIEREKNDLKTENTEIRKKYTEIRKEITETRKENEEFRNKYVEINNKLDNIVKDNKEMKEKMEENEERMKRVVESLNEDMKLLKEKNEILTKKFEENELKNNEKNESIEKRINQHSYTFTNMSQFKRDKGHHSPPFQLSNYEFRFAFCYHYHGIIVVCIDLLASSNELSNEWPIKKKFILEIIKNAIPVRHVEFDHNSSRYKSEYGKVKSCNIYLEDSVIRTDEAKSIFENDNLNLKLTLY